MSKSNSSYDIQIPNYLKFSKVISWLMYFWVMIGVISLSLRVFLLAFSANTAAGFANLVMEISSDYLRPFRGIFEIREIGETGYLDISALFAIIIYLFVAWGFKSLTEYIELKIEQNRTAQKEAIERRNLDELLAGKNQISIRKNSSGATAKRTNSAARN